MGVAFCICFACLASPQFFAPALSGLLFIAGIASAALATLQRHNPLSKHLTAWDEAAWSFMLSLGIHLAVPAPQL
jgi:hypothetical protein